MSKPKRYQPHNLTKRGLSILDQLKISEMSKKREEEIKQETQDKVLKYMLLIPLMTLKENYWLKADQSKMREFYRKMVVLYEQFGDNTYNTDDIEKYFKDILNIDIQQLINDLEITK